jgi:AcrR family transcriptional regulator
VALKSRDPNWLRHAARVETTRPPWRPTPGSPDSSDRTRVEILWAAERVLATAGYAAFTVRAVAAAAGITPGNLAYHYKTKRELIRAVITSMIAEYTKKIDESLKTPSPEPGDAFAKLIAWLIHDSTTPVTSRLFRELWAMALHDSFIKEAVENLYARCAMRIVNVLHQSHPDLGAIEAKEIAYLLLMICEGTNPIYGTCPKRGAPISKVSKLAVGALLQLVKERQT